MSENANTPGVAGWPRLLLRLEGLVLFVLALLLYQRVGTSWWLFVVLILAPDISLAGYLAGPRIGAIVYNAFHTLTGPMILVALGLTLPGLLAIQIALVWIAHIGVDRALGYGLKYRRGFAFTHFGQIGRVSASET